MQSNYRLLPLQNQVQEYAWGSRTAIPELLGRPSPAPTPQAELWMGAHPKAPSLALTADGPVPLPELIRADPAGILGAEVAERFAGQLPFLFKVLAAAEPLSIQVHPDSEQAQEGFRRENEQGLDLEDPRRNYRDANHKPEIICALTPFLALVGFRPPQEVLRLLGSAGISELAELAARGLRPLFSGLLGLEQAARVEVVGRALAWARGPGVEPADRPLAEWILRLQEHRPGDPGVLAPLLLNLLRLEPGQAQFLGAGVPHAYLGGVGIELMANSDNVIRGGLTPKHVDVPELLRVLRFEGAAPRLVESRVTSPGERLYPTPAAEFLLAQLTVTESRPHRSAARSSVEILICLEGSVQASCPAAGPALVLERGQSLLVPAALPSYELRGEGRLFRASVPFHKEDRL
jgi:mannose-6-phosphate isomerase